MPNFNRKTELKNPVRVKNYNNLSFCELNKFANHVAQLYRVQKGIGNEGNWTISNAFQDLNLIGALNKDHQNTFKDNFNAFVEKLVKGTKTKKSIKSRFYRLLEKNNQIHQYGIPTEENMPILSKTLQSMQKINANFEKFIHKTPRQTAIVLFASIACGTLLSKISNIILPKDAA